MVPPGDRRRRSTRRSEVRNGVKTGNVYNDDPRVGVHDKTGKEHGRSFWMPPLKDVDLVYGDLEELLSQLWTRRVLHGKRLV